MMDERQVIAQYQAISDSWTDMPEAHPRARCRVPDGVRPQVVSVMDDRSIVCDTDLVQIDTYQDEKYADVRAEGEARHGNQG
jgi:hypothetical protein